MLPRFLQHVSLWLDDDSIDDRGFSQAVQWALLLGLPLRLVVTSTQFSPDSRVQHNATRWRERGHTPIVEKAMAWGVECAQKGIVVETSFWSGRTESGLERLVRPYGIFVFEEHRYDRFRDELVIRGARIPGAMLMFFPPAGLPVTRMVVLYQHMNPNAAYLETAVRLCRALDVQPLVLIVARTDRDAGLKRCHAEGVCASMCAHADFDAIVGADPHSALRHMVSSRNYTHLIVEREHAHSRWPHLQGDWLEPWRGLSDSLSILGLPEALALDVPPRVQDMHRGPHRSLNRAEAKPI
jgi:hypothetical protein